MSIEPKGDFFAGYFVSERYIAQQGFQRAHGPPLQQQANGGPRQIQPVVSAFRGSRLVAEEFQKTLVVGCDPRLAENRLFKCPGLGTGEKGLPDAKQNTKWEEKLGKMHG